MIMIMSIMPFCYTCVSTGFYGRLSNVPVEGGAKVSKIKDEKEQAIITLPFDVPENNT